MPVGPLGFIDAPASFSVAGVGPLHCVADLPADAASVVLGAVSLDRRGNRRPDLACVAAVLLAAVDPADHGQLWQLLSRRAPPVTLRTWADIVMWAVEQTTGWPYGHARQLIATAADRWPLIRGRMLLAGADPKMATLRDVLDVSYASIVDDVASGAGRARTELDKRLDAGWVDRETWGMGPTAEAGQRAMMGA